MCIRTLGAMILSKSLGDLEVYSILFYVFPFITVESFNFLNLPITRTKSCFPSLSFTPHLQQIQVEHLTVLVVKFVVTLGWLCCETKWQPLLGMQQWWHSAWEKAFAIDNIRIPQKPWDESLRNMNVRLMQGTMLENTKKHKENCDWVAEKR